VKERILWVRQGTLHRVNGDPPAEEAAIMPARKKKILTLYDAAIESEKRYEFQNAKKAYKKITALYPNSSEAEIARERIGDMDALSDEKRIYRRIDRNAKRILTEIGIDFSNCVPIMDLLMEADGIDLEGDHALFVPLREDFLDYCIDQVPTDLDADPGENAFGTGATPPFLLRPGRDALNSPTAWVFSACRWPPTNPFPILKAPS
jgi:trimethylamine--corrinoid protein Co-methyltransferase